MGNKASCFNEDELSNDDNPLNTAERQSLRKKYDEIFVTGASIEDNKARFLAEFQSDHVPHFSMSVYDLCRNTKTDSVPSFGLFQKFTIDVSRSTSSNIIRKIWDLVCPDESPVVGHSRTNLFLQLMLEFSSCDRRHLATTAARLTEHLEYVSSSFANRNKHRDNGGVLDTEIEPNSIMDSATEVAQLIDWVNEYAPHTAKVFVTFFNSKLFPGVEMQGGYKPFLAPIIDPDEDSDIIRSSCDLMPLALYDINLQGRWKRLYTTQKDGLSFNRIAHHILGYGGPNIILIRCAGSGIVLGAYNEDSWKESNRFYGSSFSFLFTIMPHMHIFRSKSNSNNAYQWLNLKSYGMPHGLGMGGDLEKFRLYLPDTLEGCTARNNCLTFETGSFFNDYRKASATKDSSSGNNSPGVQGPDFDIDVMEVWGCGGEASLEHALQAQAKDRGDRDALIQKARQVDKAQFANNTFDQEFLLGKTFAHKVRMADDACQHATDSKVGKGGVPSSNVV